MDSQYDNIETTIIDLSSAIINLNTSRASAIINYPIQTPPDQDDSEKIMDKQM
jgi:hypothetical protein